MNIPEQLKCFQYHYNNTTDLMLDVDVYEKKIRNFVETKFKKVPPFDHEFNELVFIKYFSQFTKKTEDSPLTYETWVDTIVRVSTGLYEKLIDHCSWSNEVEVFDLMKEVTEDMYYMRALPSSLALQKLRNQFLREIGNQNVNSYFMLNLKARYSNNPMNLLCEAFETMLNGTNLTYDVNCFRDFHILTPDYKGTIHFNKKPGKLNETFSHITRPLYKPGTKEFEFELAEETHFANNTIKISNNLYSWISALKALLNLFFEKKYDSFTPEGPLKFVMEDQEITKISDMFPKGVFPMKPMFYKEGPLNFITEVITPLKYLLDHNIEKNLTVELTHEMFSILAGAAKKIGHQRFDITAQYSVVKKDEATKKKIFNETDLLKFLTLRNDYGGTYSLVIDKSFKWDYSALYRTISNYVISQEHPFTIGWINEDGISTSNDVTLFEGESVHGSHIFLKATMTEKEILSAVKSATIIAKILSTEHNSRKWQNKHAISVSLSGLVDYCLQDKEDVCCYIKHFLKRWKKKTVEISDYMYSRFNIPHSRVLTTVGNPVLLSKMVNVSPGNTLTSINDIHEDKMKLFAVERDRMCPEMFERMNEFINEHTDIGGTICKYSLPDERTIFFNPLQDFDSTLFNIASLCQKYWADGLSNLRIRRTAYLPPIIIEEYIRIAEKKVGAITFVPETEKKNIFTENYVFK